MKNLLIIFITTLFLTSCGWGTFVQDMNSANNNPNRTSFAAEMQEIRDAGGDITYTAFMTHNAIFQGDNVPKTLEQHNSYFCEYTLNGEKYFKIVAYEATDHLTALVCTDLKLEGYYEQEGPFNWFAGCIDMADDQKCKLLFSAESSTFLVIYKKGEYGRAFKGSILSGINVPRN